MPPPLRGSRKHIMEWIATPRFLHELNAMIAHADVAVTPNHRIMPTGQGTTPDREARLETFLSDKAIAAELQTWWLAAPGGANTPNWDLAAEATHRGRPALLLLEAKANVPELSDAGKAEPKGKRRPDGKGRGEPSENSKRNHTRIAAALKEAEEALNQIERGFLLDRDSHYQLSNRIAFSWKLASMGIPTVLVYLGFTGDEGIADAGPKFDDAAHWEKSLRAHIKGRIPDKLLGRWFDVGEAGFYLMTAARERLSDSSPPIPRRKPSPPM